MLVVLLLLLHFRMAGQESYYLPTVVSKGKLIGMERGLKT